MLKETPTQVFSCEICKILKNTVFYRTPPVAASGKFRILIFFTTAVVKVEIFKTNTDGKVDNASNKKQKIVPGSSS